MNHSAKPGSPEVTPFLGAELLERHHKAGEAILSNRPIDRDEYATWEMVARNYLEKAFGNSSPNIASVMNVGKYGSFPVNAGEDWRENHRAKSLQAQLSKIRGLIELLLTEASLREDHIIASNGSSPAQGYRIFLVHGHDERALHETARFLERLKQEVVILREQPNAGLTIVEKFESYADVGFAVILLTADDKGGPRESDVGSFQDRARENVIFELGYFIGRLGRNRVCALYHSNVEIPSDYSGVLYLPFDQHGAWQLQLAKELRAAGLPVDMNNAL